MKLILSFAVLLQFTYAGADEEDPTGCLGYGCERDRDCLSGCDYGAPISTLYCDRRQTHTNMLGFDSPGTCDYPPTHCGPSHACVFICRYAEVCWTDSSEDVNTFEELNRIMCEEDCNCVETENESLMCRPEGVRTPIEVPGYTVKSPGCVNGDNIILYKNKTPAQCAAYCDSYGSGCLGFEFGVDHGGIRGSYDEGDCQLSSGDNTLKCDGEGYNLEFYTKEVESSDSWDHANGVNPDDKMAAMQYMAKASRAAAEATSTLTPWGHEVLVRSLACVAIAAVVYSLWKYVLKKAYETQNHQKCTVTYESVHNVNVA